MIVCQWEWFWGFHVESQVWVPLRAHFFALDPLPEIWRCSNARFCWPEGTPDVSWTLLQACFYVAVHLPQNLHPFNDSTAFQRSTTTAVMVAQEAVLEFRGKLKTHTVKLWRNCQIVQQLGDTDEFPAVLMTLRVLVFLGLGWVFILLVWLHSMILCQIWWFCWSVTNLGASMAAFTLYPFEWDQMTSNCQYIQYTLDSFSHHDNRFEGVCQRCSCWIGPNLSTCLGGFHPIWPTWVVSTPHVLRWTSALTIPSCLTSCGRYDSLGAGINSQKRRLTWLVPSNSWKLTFELTSLPVSACVFRSVHLCSCKSKKTPERSNRTARSSSWSFLSESLTTRITPLANLPGDPWSRPPSLVTALWGWYPSLGHCAWPWCYPKWEVAPLKWEMYGTKWISQNGGTPAWMVCNAKFY